MNKYQDQYFKDDRYCILWEHIKDKKGLNIGVDYLSLNHKDKTIFDMDFLVDYAKEVKGIDINQNGVKILRQSGYDVYLGNAEDYNSYPGKQDFIYSADLIEHLNNPGIFLNNCYDSLKKGGYLIIETPNAFGLMNFFVKQNKDHTFMFNAQLIKTLLERHNFKVKSIDYVDRYRFRKSLKGYTRDLLTKLLGKRSKSTLFIIAEK